MFVVWNIQPNYIPLVVAIIADIHSLIRFKDEAFNSSAWHVLLRLLVALFVMGIFLGRIFYSTWNILNFLLLSGYSAFLLFSGQHWNWHGVQILIATEIPAGIVFSFLPCFLLRVVSLIGKGVLVPFMWNTHSQLYFPMKEDDKTLLNICRVLYSIFATLCCVELAEICDGCSSVSASMFIFSCVVGITVVPHFFHYLLCY